MERVAFVLVDTGLTTVGSRGNVSAPDPGLALIDGTELLVGADAERNARLKPRRIHSRFWQSPATQPLKRPFPHHLRTADLVHAHLSATWNAIGRDSKEVILVLPGLYSDEQLALLLGIAVSAGIPVRGMIDVAVAAAANRATRTRCLHLDLHLHRTVLTELEHRDQVVRGRVRVNDRIGAVGLDDLWLRTIARHFIRQTRFDPLHQAVTEQLLYLQLGRHREALAESATARITIPSGGRQHAIDLDRREICEATRSEQKTLTDWVRAHTESEPTTVLVSDRLAAVPGLLDDLRETGDLEAVQLHPAAAGSSALGHSRHIISTAKAIPFVTRLPGYDARPPGPVTVAVTPPPGTKPQASSPTHLVIDGVAQPISEAPTVIVQSPDGPSGSEQPGDIVVRRVDTQVVIEAPPGTEVRINGQSVESSATLAAGDRLQVGGSEHEILLVTMVT